MDLRNEYALHVIERDTRLKSPVWAGSCIRGGLAERLLQGLWGLLKRLLGLFIVFFRRLVT